MLVFSYNKAVQFFYYFCLSCWNFKKNIASVLFSLNRDCLKHLFHPHSDPFSPEAVRYREEMMRTPAALKYPSGASASHNEGTSFIKKKSQNIIGFWLGNIIRISWYISSLTKRLAQKIVILKDKKVSFFNCKSAGIFYVVFM